jgi:dTDP-4-amino-4,6-dideoxygalactose transaminase
MINVFQPALQEEELEAVRRVFASNWIGKGKITDQFESDFAVHLGVERDLIRSVSCCTEGLFQSMDLLGIGAEDEVILPTISFVGAANAVAAAGARIKFCDVDRRTLNATAEFIEQQTTPRTKAVIILHYGGLPCEMDEICDFLKRKGIALIEDSACSVASRYKGKFCGTFGSIGLWSFDAMKILVSGDGGMIYCGNEDLARRAQEMLYLGLTTKSGFSSAVDNKWWEFEISCYGRRGIMNDVTSAIGIEQLKKLPGFVERRREIHEYYDRLLSPVEWLQTPPRLPDYCESSFYFYWIQTAPDIRDRLAAFLKERGIYTTFRYYPLHCVEFYGVSVGLPNAEQAAQSTLCLPIHQALSNGDLEKIVEAIWDFGKTV